MMQKFRFLNEEFSKSSIICDWIIEPKAFKKNDGCNNIDGVPITIFIL